MKERPYFLNILLTVLWTLVLAAFMICKAFFPANILPPFDIPLLLGVILIALLLDRKSVPRTGRALIFSVVLAALTFGALPLCAGLAGNLTALKLAVAGGITFAVSDPLYRSMLCRLSSGAKTRFAPLISAFGLFLAGQCFTGIFF